MNTKHRVTVQYLEHIDDKIFMKCGVQYIIIFIASQVRDYEKEGNLLANWIRSNRRGSCDKAMKM